MSIPRPSASPGLGVDQRLTDGPGPDRKEHSGACTGFSGCTGVGEPNFQAHLWTYLSPQVEDVVFDFAPDRTHEHVLEFLGPDFAGFTIGDGYAGYDTIATKRPGVIVGGCWAHVLRKFRDALAESPVDASRMMSLIGKLFDVERLALERQLDADGVRALRADRSRPALERIHEHAETLPASGSEPGELVKAVKYVLNQWIALTRFLQDGRVPIHNNDCENAIRPIAVGRRNWLFAGSERGGEAAATAYSLVESCKRVDVDPFVSLRDVLVRVATHPASRVDELVPALWKTNFGHACTR